MRDIMERGAALPLLAIIIVVIVIIAIVGMILIYPWKVINIDEERSVDVTSAVGEIDLSVDQAIGKVMIVFSGEAIDAVTMTVTGTLRQNLFASVDPLSIAWSQRVVGERLVVSIEIDVMAYSATFGSQELETTIIVPSQLSAMVNATGMAGSIELTAGDGAVLRGGHISETTGSAIIDLSGCSLIGPLNVQTTTGGCTLRWTDVIALDQAQVNIDCTTGGISMEVSQLAALGGNITIRSTATAGGVNLDLSIEGGNSARVVSDTDLGGINVKTMTGFGGSDNDLRSSNYPTQSSLNVDITTEVGGIDLSLEYMP